MNAIKEFVKTTVVGGLIFLVPVVVLALVLKHAMVFAGKVAAPIAAMLPVGRVAGIAVGTIVAVLVLMLLAFAAGLLARTEGGRRVARWFEESLLGGLPQYRMVKSLAEGLAQVESSDSMQPVLVRGDDGWQLGYRIEDLGSDWVAVFLPQSPTPMSGNVVYVAASRVRPLDMPMADAAVLVKRMGIGSQEALRQVDLGSDRDA
jgi:uncharacterized membrane protein